MKKLEAHEIGYYGKSIESLSREELILAFTDLANAVYECSKKNGTCREALTFNERHPKTEEY
jgi:hypothetical protein